MATKRTASFVTLLRQAHRAGLTDQELKESLVHWWRLNAASKFDNQQSELLSFQQLAEAVHNLVQYPSAEARG